MGRVALPMGWESELAWGAQFQDFGFRSCLSQQEPPSGRGDDSGNSYNPLSRPLLTLTQLFLSLVSRAIFHTSRRRVVCRHSIVSSCSSLPTSGAPHETTIPRPATLTPSSCCPSSILYPSILSAPVAVALSSTQLPSPD